MHVRAFPLTLLIVSILGMLVFSQGLRLVDTIALLGCGVLAGGALATLAADRARGKRP
jgi:hypothetical protein